MDYKTPQRNCCCNNRSSAPDPIGASASGLTVGKIENLTCLEFEGAFRQFVYELKQNEKLRNIVTIIAIILAVEILVLIYECYFHRS
jgi:hypothetical protein